MRVFDGHLSYFLLNAHKELSATKASINNKLVSIETRVVALDQLTTAIKADTAESKAAVIKLQAKITGLRRDLDERDDSIPKQYHNPSARTG
jgi:peptidoglycan hydrolase CwlO-like protein